MSAPARHRRTGSQGRWKGWYRQPKHAPVVVTQGPLIEAEPMTEAQAKYLRSLCGKAGEKFNPTWTKRQASIRIRQLKRRLK